MLDENPSGSVALYEDFKVSVFDFACINSFIICYELMVSGRFFTAIFRRFGGVPGVLNWMDDSEWNGMEVALARFCEICDDAGGLLPDALNAAADGVPVVDAARVVDRAADMGNYLHNASLFLDSLNEED